MSRTARKTPVWEWAGLIAALFIVISLPAYYFLVEQSDQETTIAFPAPTFTGSESCQECHNTEFENWQGSHHDLAMDVANDDTVLGDFDEAEFSAHGVTSRFYRKDGRFFVHTNGPGGEMRDFEITHTFGWYPLQQYLVPFPGGRLQTLPIAWDSRDGQWFRVPPDEPVAPDDWLYWTNAAQNWNGMCAQCHSTNLKKNYDPVTDSYNTTWSDIDVGCEACHGPGSAHVEWAELPDMARPQANNFELVLRTSGISSPEQVALCAPCHSRRSSIADDAHDGAEFMDLYLPSLLAGDLYYADGQILEEVYVYGSFTQSKMYRHDVRCSDCHDVHSIKLVKEGNELCLQCHRHAQYDTTEHHFHKQAGEAGDPIMSAEGEVLFEVGTGAQCVQCHMPGRYYMGNDYRPDHSFRIPDPELAAAIDAPDACLRCHVDKQSDWSRQTVLEWYGPGQAIHYGNVIASGRNGDPDAADKLISLAADPLYPVIARATAISLLASYPGEATLQAMDMAMMDEEARIRRAAVESIVVQDPGDLAKRMASMLRDPVVNVRIEAARRLASGLTEHLDSRQTELFQSVLKEFVSAMNYSADFAFARYNLGNLYNDLGDPAKAIDSYQAAMRIDNQFYPAKVNLALLYNRQGKNNEAETLLREVVASQPEMYEVSYSLGLLLVEVRKYRPAVEFLENAVAGLPERARIRYNLGLLYQHLGDLDQAANALAAALALDSQNLDFQYALADHYLKRGMFEDARPIAADMASMHPEQPIGGQMLEFIRRNTGQ